MTSWQCPYCNHFTIVSHKNRTMQTIRLNEKSKQGPAGLEVTSTACANPECIELTVDLAFGQVEVIPRTHSAPLLRLLPMPRVLRRRLLPEAKVISLPDEVPDEIKITYSEAVLIADLSGRASAAMARRCLQGIVRDFFQVPQEKRGNLGAELSLVKEQISPDLWSDIVALRSVGDIGAHMDKNVNEIIDVSPDEAKILIQLIETLFTEWYIARAKRRQRSESLATMLSSKRDAQKLAKASARVGDEPES